MRLSPPPSPPETKAPPDPLCPCAVVSWACLWAPGGYRGASTSDDWALGGVPYLGPGWVRAMLIHCVGGKCCVVLCVMCPGRMQVQWPGRWVAGCGSCRRVQLVAVVCFCWPALGGPTFLACVCVCVCVPLMVSSSSSCLCLPAYQCVSL